MLLQRFQALLQRQRLELDLHLLHRRQNALGKRRCDYDRSKLLTLCWRKVLQIFDELLNCSRSSRVLLDLNDHRVSLRIDSVNVDESGSNFLLEIYHSMTLLDLIRLCENGLLHFLLTRVEDQLGLVPQT